MQYAFKKVERLHRQKTISKVFTEGISVVKYPFRAVFLTSKQEGWPCCEALFSVSKKRFKRAHTRNLLKRRMREAYRLQKQSFYTSLSELNIHLSLALIYIPKEELDFESIQKGMTKLFQKIIIEIKEGRNHEQTDTREDNC